MAPAEARIDVAAHAMNDDVMVRSGADYAVSMLDPNGLVTTWNTGAKRIKGFDAAEIVGRHFSVFLEEADRRAGLHDAILAEARRSGRFEGEGWHVRKDGTLFWAHVLIEAMVDAAGVLRGFTEVTRDLTEDRRLRHAVHHQEQTFRWLVQSVADYAIYMLDPHGRVTNWNSGAERIKGFEADEIVGQHFSRFYTREDRARGEPSRSLAVARRDGRFETEGWRVRKDGTRFWASVAICPIFDPSRRMIGFAKVTRDITERHEARRALDEAMMRERAANLALEQRVAERTADLQRTNENLVAALGEGARVQQALTRSEAEFRAGFEGSAVGRTLEEVGTRRILRANRAYADMLGCEPQDLIGRVSTDFMWLEDAALDARKRADLVGGEAESNTYEMRFLRPGGAPFWVRVSTTLARVVGGESEMLAVTSVENVDARRKAEAQLQAAKTDLERVVEERTNALRQRDLLLREVYHRVKNNLQIVDSLIFLQARQIADAPARTSLLNLRDRLYTLGLVHHQLMGSPDLKTFDCAPFLRELGANLLDSGGRSGVTLSVDAMPLTVNLDFAIPLGMVVTELVTNSLKHAFGDGRGQITVTLRADNERNVRLSVADDGRPGDGRSDVEGRAVGLGANLIKGFLAQIGGTMTVRHDRGTITDILAKLPVMS